MDETNTKPIRRFLHLGKSVAPQVREQAARWGLGEMEAIHQLIRLGLRASSSAAGTPEEAGSDPRHEYLRLMLSEMLFVQVETLLYQRELAADLPPVPAADSLAAPAAGKRSQRLTELDDKVRPQARTAVRKIRENVEKAAADRAKRANDADGPGA